MVARCEKGQELLSPLRYPGGKRKLAAYIADTIRLNGLHPKLFVEPFAGGASVSLYLLEQGVVDQIALGEKDEIVAAFWKTVFFDHEWLIEQIEQVKPTLELWQSFRQSEPMTDREKAMKCLFLNRTSFSGILNKTAGPLGGKKQASKYPIDCRFYPQTVVSRIQMLAQLSNRVRFIHQGDWQETLIRTVELGLRKRDVFYYLDPPFYLRADRLYRYWFTDNEHVSLSDKLSGLVGFYLLSYDAAPEIVRLYCNNGNGSRRVKLLYTAASNNKRIAEEIIVSNLEVLPMG
jgi:DNA adenine methylase